MVTVIPKHVLRGQLDCKIRITGPHAEITGKFPLAVVRKATSYYAAGFLYSRAYQRKVWDGKKHLFDAVTSTMPAGLTSIVVEALKEYDPTGRIELVDETENVRPAIGNKGFALKGIEFGQGKFDYQLAAAHAMVEKRKGVLRIATNGGKTEVAVAVTQHLALPTLFLVDRITLVYQTIKRFSSRLGIPEADIGFIGDGEFRLGAWITVATPASLENRLALPEVEKLINSIQVVFSDECHHAASETHYTVLAQIPAVYRFGLSGTPLDRTDGADLRLVAQTGPILYDVPNRLLVERGISVPPFVEMLKIHNPALPEKEMEFREVERLGIVENPHLNTKAATKAIEHARNGEQVLLLVEKTKQGQLLADLMTKFAGDLPWEYMTGSTAAKKRLITLEKFTKQKVKILIATTILDEGVDVPNIDVLILCAGGKAKIRLLQRIGRGLRSHTGKTQLLVYDFANFTHRWLLRHSLSRLSTYKDEACFEISSG